MYLYQAIPNLILNESVNIIIILDSNMKIKLFNARRVHYNRCICCTHYVYNGIICTASYLKI